MPPRHTSSAACPALACLLARTRPSKAKHITSCTVGKGEENPTGIPCRVSELWTLSFAKLYIRSAQCEYVLCTKYSQTVVYLVQYP